MSDDRYARVKFSIMDDGKFDGIREVPALIGSWTLCLVVAEMAWPSPAFPPPWVPRSSFRRLVDAGLIDPLPNGCFRIHGLDAERSRRKEHAQTASNARWNAPSIPASNAPASAPGMPSKAKHEQSKAEQDARAGFGEGYDGRADLEAFLIVRKRPPTAKQRTVLDRYCRAFDQTGPERAAQLIYAHPDDPIGAVLSDLDAFVAERTAEAKAAERPKPRHRPAPGLTGINAEIAKLVFANDHESGRHAGDPDPACHLCSAVTA